MVVIVSVAVLLLGPYLALRVERKPGPAPLPTPTVQVPVAPTHTDPAAAPLTAEQAVEVARKFCDAVGWKAEGELRVTEPEWASVAGINGWKVAWKAPYQDRNVVVDKATGRILSAMDYVEGNWERAHPGAPDLSTSQLVDSATKFAQAAGLPSDYRLVEGELSPRQPGKEEFIVEFQRCFEDAIYKDDLMTLSLHPDTGHVSLMGFRCRMQPPPDVARNISQARAEQLGREYLADPAKMGSSAMKVASVNKVQLMVVRPGSAMVAGTAHVGEPSRIAWVVTFNRYGIAYDHINVAWIDVEDGSFLGSDFCG